MIYTNRKLELLNETGRLLAKLRSTVSKPKENRWVRHCLGCDATWVETEKAPKDHQCSPTNH